jgi:glycosyltransferase involved in cell wall biosynthesis
VSTVAAQRPLLKEVAAPRVSVVIPCLNEAENIEECVRRAQLVLGEHDIRGEVVVVDNGSEDGSGRIAREAGARVIDEPRRGYGQAYLTGFDAARGDYVVMIDADLTYDFHDIPRFVNQLDEGADLVMGNRLDDVQPGAMSILSRIGNPILSGFLNLLYRTPIGDAHCGMRAFRRDLLPSLALRSTGMEFASEMVIRASKENLDVRELPIALHVRGGESKLSPFRDGWRHLRLMLVYSPDFLFLVPGMLMTLLGAATMAAVLFHLELFGRSYYIHTAIAGSLLVIIGLQIASLGLIARTYAVYFMGERDRFLERMQARVKLEHGLIAGGSLIFAALLAGAAIIVHWASQGAGNLGDGVWALVAATALVAGLQIFFTSFLLSIIGLRRPR